MFLNVKHACKFIYPEVLTHPYTEAVIEWRVSGLRKHDFYYPDGRLRSRNVIPPELQVSLSLIAPGSRSVFDYDEKQERWCIFLNEPYPFYYDPEKKCMMFHLNDMEFSVPDERPVSPEEIPEMRRVFEKIFLEVHNRTVLPAYVPHEQFQAELLAASVLMRFLESSIMDDPSAEIMLYKQKIDSDVRWEKTLDELASECGFSRDYMRQGFMKRYSATPVEYRIRQRLALIMKLVLETDMSIKEIAQHTGIAHVSYLNALCRRYYQMTPLELINRFRKPR